MNYFNDFLQNLFHTCIAFQLYHLFGMYTLKMLYGIWASPRENLSSWICEQQSRRTACASAQTDQRICYSRFGKYDL